MSQCDGVEASLDSDFNNSEQISGRSPSWIMSWKRQAERVHTEAYVFYFVFKHPRTRWYARLLAACTASYLFSPIQLIPSFIPVIGFLDDFLVLFLGAKLLQRITPPDLLAECRAKAIASKTRRDEEIGSTSGTVVAFVIVTLWLVATVAVARLAASHLPR